MVLLGEHQSSCGVYRELPQVIKQEARWSASVLEEECCPTAERPVESHPDFCQQDFQILSA